MTISRSSRANFELFQQIYYSRHREKQPAPLISLVRPRTRLNCNVENAPSAASPARPPDSAHEPLVLLEHGPERGEVVALALHRPAVDLEHDVALAQVDHVGVDVAQRDHALVVLDEDRLGAGVAYAVADVHHEAVAVVGSDDLGLGEVGGDLLGHAELVDVDVGVGRDDGAGRKVDALAHEVTAHTARLGAEAGFQGLERAPGSLRGGGHALDVVVHVGRHVVLEVRGHLFDVVAGLTAVDLLAQFLVATHDVDELVREVVVHALVVVHDDGRADGERGHGEHGADHPGGATVVRVEAQNADGGVGEALEAPEDHLGLEGHELGVGAGGGAGLLAVEGADGALDLDDLVEHRGLADGT